MDLMKKAVGLVDTVETDSPNGAFEVVLSAATLDRDGEVIDSRAFDPLPEHVPFDIDHGMTVQTTVGSGQPYYAEDGSLRVKGTFASTPLAQEVRTLVAEGHIRTTSVTFMAAKRVKDAKGIDHVQTAELLNGTFTPVPSNREAVVLSAKAFAAVTDEKVGARNSTKDADAIQGVHDAAIGLGAACAAKSVKSVAVDEARAVLADFDSSDLPAEVAEAISLLTASDADEPIAVMDAVTEDEGLEAADEAAGAAADEAAAPAVKSAAPDPDVLARLRITENAARIAFGA